MVSELSIFLMQIQLVQQFDSGVSSCDNRFQIAAFQGSGSQQFWWLPDHVLMCKGM
jgi:hypothetical protein